VCGLYGEGGGPPPQAVPGSSANPTITLTVTRPS
jgi:hypothetical protein